LFFCCCRCYTGPVGSPPLQQISRSKLHTIGIAAAPAAAAIVSHGQWIPTIAGIQRGEQGRVWGGATGQGGGLLGGGASKSRALCRTAEPCQKNPSRQLAGLLTNSRLFEEEEGWAPWPPGAGVRVCCKGWPGG
jgi:hypothetical protein